MSVSWVKYAEVRTGKYCRQSFTAAVADGTLCREVVLYDAGVTTQGNGSQAPDPGSHQCRLICEAMCFVPTAAGVPTSWTSESSIQSGERVDALQSNPCSVSGKLYLNITSAQDPQIQSPSSTSSLGQHKLLACSLCFMA